MLEVARKMWTSVNLHPLRSLTDRAVEVSVQPRFGKLSFQPGQFIVLEIELESGIRRRPFSIVRADGEGFILGIKKNGEGGISSFLQQLQGPIKANIAGPFGDFHVDKKATRHVFLIGGSGITPVLGMLDVLKADNQSVRLIYANQSEAQAMYLPSLRQKAERENLTLIEVYDQNLERALEGVDLVTAAVYACGPPGFVNVALAAAKAHGAEESRIQVEKYDLDFTGEELSNVFVWRSLWRVEHTIPLEGQRSILEGAIHHKLGIPHACEVGVCGSCKARVISGEVLCGTERRGAGENILTCISQPVGEHPPVLGAIKRGRAEMVTAALLIGAVILGLWWVPPAQGFKAMGPMNSGHENLDCGACHRDAPGTLRQQLTHNTRSLLGFHESALVPVGALPVENEVCLDCHNRPNDRHPTSRFMETRFAAQRASLGPHECNNCHGEHHGERVAMVEPGFCINCHQDLTVNQDPIQPSHAALIEGQSWETCLQCHDFHGNHIREVPEKLAEGIPQATILGYLQGGPDPYGADKTFKATQND